MHHPLIVGEKVLFRVMVESDAEGPHLDWLNDEEVTRFLSTVGRFSTSAENARQCISSMAESDRDVPLAIHDSSSNNIIGTSHFGPVDWVHRTGPFGTMIGDKTFWGKGYGMESFFRMTDCGFRRLNLHKIMLGAVSEQTAAIRYMRKLGYAQEATHREEFFYNGRYVDVPKFDLIDRDFRLGRYREGWPREGE